MYDIGFWLNCGLVWFVFRIGGGIENGCVGGLKFGVCIDLGVWSGLLMILFLSGCNGVKFKLDTFC